MHLALSPGKQRELGEKYNRKMLRFGQYVQRLAANPGAEACIEPLTQDERFSSEAWQQWLAEHSSGRVAPPPLGSDRHPPLDAAPGRFVRMP